MTPTDLIHQTRHSSTSHRQEPANLARSDRFRDLMRRDHSEENKERNASPMDEDLEPVCTEGILLSQLLSSSGSGMANSLLPQAEIAPLFEEVATTMILMHRENEQETTLFLDGPKFESSVFHGTRITIKEFSTAPKAFNVEIASHPVAVNLLEAHKAALVAAFEGGKFPFTVHRLDTELHAEKKQGDSHDRNQDRDEEHP